ncbi:hypothetical protein BD779DRAFT_1457444, partial [Infundibulicybe gibba]
MSAHSAALQNILLEPAQRHEIFPIVTPLHFSCWALALREAGLHLKYPDIPAGIRDGFRCGVEAPCTSLFMPPNAHSALNNTSAVDAILDKEI